MSDPAPAPASPAAPPRTLSGDVWRRLRANKTALACGAVLLLLGLAALFAPLLAPYSYRAQDLALGATPPSWQHWMGTDVLGRDLFTRILYGSRVSLSVGLLATAVALLIGVLWGTVAGYAGGALDTLMMRVVDVLYAVPFVLLVILLMVAFGRSLWLLFLAIGAVEWMTMARIVRGQVLSLRSREFVLAAQALGVSRGAIIRRHLIPNTLSAVIVYGTLTIPSVIILEAFLSFLGLGIQEPSSSWGLLISYGVESMEDSPWILLFPAAVFSLTLFCLNFFGDGLRDALDPRSDQLDSPS